jgi:CheY-like chemotaxis protein
LRELKNNPLLYSGLLSIISADDDPDDQFLIRQAVKDSCTAFEFHVAANGSELLEKLLRHGRHRSSDEIKPDFVLLDINMPVMDGFETLKRIRSHEQLRLIPTYILTTSRSEKEKEKCMLFGADAFYSKPAEFSLLRDIMSEIVARCLAAKHPDAVIKP